MNNKLGIFVNFWTNTWACDHVYYLQKAKKIGYDILEFQAQALLDMTDARMEEIKAAAKDRGMAKSEFYKLVAND